MRKIDELKGPSCLTAAKDNEYVFVLKSTDPLAPMCVRSWARNYWNSKRQQPGGITKAQIAKYEDALEVADSMDRWRKENNQ